MRKSFLLLPVMGLFAFSALAQESIPFDDLPPTAEYGKCYAKCKTPDQYETVSVDVLVAPSRTKYITVPAEYETLTEQVLVKEGGVNYKVIPATYRTIEEQVLVEPERTKIKTIPARYKTEKYQVLVSEARGEWVKKKKSPNCFSQNPEDCYVVCWEEVPAQYRTDSRQVLVSEAQTVEEVIPARYKTVKKRIIDQPSRVEEVPYEAKYRTVSSRKMISPETVREEVIPAVYKTKTERRLVAKGGYTVWTEILCESKTTSSTVRSLQNALLAAGYDPGPIDGVMGIKTQTAMKQYQTDKSLPVGNMNIQTLQSLGVQ